MANPVHRPDSHMGPARRSKSAPGLPRALLPLPLLRVDSPSPALVEASVALPAEGEGGVTSWGIGCVASKCLQAGRVSGCVGEAHAQLGLGWTGGICCLSAVRTCICTVSCR